METDTHFAESGNDITWFVEDILEYSTGVPGGREDSSLLKLCDRFRNGRTTVEESQRYKLAAIEYITNHLATRTGNEQQAFLQFLLQSELINECTEIRNTLHTLLQSRLTLPLDRLSLNIAASLLRSNRPPSETLIQEMFGKVHAEHLANPSWSHVGILAASIGRTGKIRYSVDDLIGDIARLADSKDFAKKLHLRNAVWTSLNPRLDSILILTKVRSGQALHRHNYPPNFAPAMKQLNSLIVFS